MRRFALLAVCFALQATLAAKPADARIVYVNNVSGDDRADGSRATVFSREIGPLRTIARALQIAHPLDVIDLAKTGDPYTEQVALAGPGVHGEEFQSMILEGHGSVLEGAVDVDPEQWEYVHEDVYRFRPAQTQFQQLMLNFEVLPRVPVAAEAAGPPALKPLQWCISRGWIYFRARPNETIESYPLQVYGAQTGLTILSVHHLTIRNLVVQHFRIDGIHAAERARAIRLENVISRENGRSGLTVSGAARVTAANCRFTGNGAAPTQTEQRGRLDLLPAGKAAPNRPPAPRKPVAQAEDENP